MNRYCLPVLLSVLIGCSNPPASISQAQTVVEKRQGSIWVFTVAGGRSLHARPGVEDVDVRVYRLPEQEQVSDVRIKTLNGDIPETKVYQIPEGESRAYIVAIDPVGHGGAVTFEIPAE